MWLAALAVVTLAGLLQLNFDDRRKEAPLRREKGCPCYRLHLEEGLRTRGERLHAAFRGLLEAFVADRAFVSAVSVFVAALGAFLGKAVGLDYLRLPGDSLHYETLNYVCESGGDLCTFRLSPWPLFRFPNSPCLYKDR